MSINLRDYKINCKELLNGIPKPDHMKETLIKLLWLQWNTVTDQLKFSTKKFTKTQPAVTKRELFGNNLKHV